MSAKVNKSIAFENVKHINDVIIRILTVIIEWSCRPGDTVFLTRNPNVLVSIALE